MLSLPHSHPLPFPKPFSTRSIQVPSRFPNSPSGFLRNPKNAYPIAHKARIQAKKEAPTESDVTQTPPVSPSAGSPASSFLSILCPLLKLFGGGDPSQERNEFLEVATSSLSSLARLPWGSKSLTGSIHSLASTNKPPQLKLYEFEACPFCRRVREALTELDLSVEVYPCPKGSIRHRELVREMGGKEQFPFLVDLNTDVSLYESGWVPTLLRAGRGMTAWQRAKSEAPSKMLKLFSYENNSRARIVRETLCELELPYILHNVGEGSSKYDLLFKASGSKEVPYLIDPNTGVNTGDYKKILSYLFQTYSNPA